MDSTTAEKLLGHLADLVDLPMFEPSDRSTLSRTLAITSLHFAASVRHQCDSRLALGSAAVLRSQFEALLRGVWALHCASDEQVEKLSSDLSAESQQATKNVPNVAAMIGAIEQIPLLANLLIALREFKDSSWLPLNSFVHSGIHAVHWTKYEPPQALLEQMFRSSNGLAVLAFQHLAILTGKPGLQGQVISACAPFSSCLPTPRP
jgi:hypothetical protein